MLRVLRPRTMHEGALQRLAISVQTVPARVQGSGRVARPGATAPSFRKARKLPVPPLSPRASSTSVALCCPWRCVDGERQRLRAVMGTWAGRRHAARATGHMVWGVPLRLPCPDDSAWRQA